MKVKKILNQCFDNQNILIADIEQPREVHGTKIDIICEYSSLLKMKSQGIASYLYDGEPVLYIRGNFSEVM